MTRVLVVGGAGRTGRRIVSVLQARGDEVVIASRSARGDNSRTLDLSSSNNYVQVVSGFDSVIASVEPPMDAGGADRVMNVAMGELAAACAKSGSKFVLVSQIYITRPSALAGMERVIEARGRGEEAIRRSGAHYAIVRPGWLHDGKVAGARLEQGDLGDGQTSRQIVAEAAVACATSDEVDQVTFEIFDSAEPRNLSSELRSLTRDAAREL